jgi:phage-related protein
MAQEKRVAILIAAKDQASRVLGSVNKGLGSLARTLTSMPALIAGAVGGLAGGAFLKSSLDAIGEQIKAEQKLQAVLTATGHAAGFSAAQLAEQAAELQRLTVFGDEVILGAQGILASFTNIRGDAFRDATETAMDLATVLNTDLDSAVKLVGRALNDPAQGLTALSRAGITFTQQQKDLIKSLVESGRAAEAQQLILAELQGRFSGAARAMAAGPLGAIQQFKNAFGDFKEAIGAQLLPAIGGAARALTGFFQEHSAQISETFGRVVQVAVGIASAVKTAVGVIGPVVIHAFVAVRDTVVPILGALLDVAVSTFRNILDFVGPIMQALYGTVSSIVGALVEAFRSGFTFITGLFGPVNDAVGGFGSIFQVVKDTVIHGLLALEFGFKNWETIATLAGLTVIESVVTVGGQIRHIFGEVIPTLLTWFADQWREIFTDIFNFTTTVFENLAGNLVAIVTNIPGLIRGTVDWSDVWTPLTAGFESAIKELPAIAERQKSALEVALEADIAAKQAALAGGFEAFAAGRLAQMQQTSEAAAGGLTQILAAFKTPGFELPQVPRPAGVPVSPALAEEEGGGAGPAVPSSRRGLTSQSLSAQFLGLAERFKASQASAGPEAQTAANTARAAAAAEEQTELLAELVRGQSKGTPAIRELHVV